MKFSFFTKKTEEQESQEQQEMIHGIRELSDTTVREIMVPRVDVTFIPSELDWPSVLEIMQASGHSRFPVRGARVDDVEGVLYIKDVFMHMIGGVESLPAISELVRPAYYVPETKKLDQLLKELRQRRVYIAVVVDEFGGVSGIVSLEDIIEEIVGEIQDEYDTELDEFVSVSAGAWDADARMLIEDLNEHLATSLPHDEFDTLGGLLVSELDRIPEIGDEVDLSDHHFVIKSMDGHKIDRVAITREEAASC